MSENKEIQTSNTGALRGKTMDEQWRLACAYAKSGMLPKSYKTPEQVLTGMQYAYELGLNPLSALKNIAVINGQPSLWGDLPLAIVRNSGKLIKIDEYLIDKDHKKICLANKNINAPHVAAVCITQREGEGEKESVYTHLMASKNGGVKEIWNKYSEIMYKRKARAIALKDSFSDILEGLNIAEYDYNIIPEAGKSYEVNHDGSEKGPNALDVLNGKSIEAEVVKEEEKEITLNEACEETMQNLELEIKIDKEKEEELTETQKAFKAMQGELEK